MNEGDIVAHLLNHESLTGEKIDAYLELATKTKGEHSYIKDPFDRSIALAFELVMDEHLNPWEIDLVSFSKLYLKRARGNGVDLVTAGRIILMAWRILKLQSSLLVEHMEEPPIDQREMDWDDVPSWYGEDESYLYTKLVMQGTPALDEKVRRKGKRKVTLMELIHAFEEIKREVSERETLRQENHKARQIMNEKAERNIDEHLVKEDTEKEIRHVWDKINEFNGEAIHLSKLCDVTDKEELVKTLSSLLFLAHERKIKLWQRKFPYGDIYVNSMNGHAKKARS
jgi:segregation and condensation protein A